MADVRPERWEDLAQKHWLASIPSKIDPEVLRSQLWTHLEAGGFTSQNLSVLENLQVLEKFLWPTFSEDSPNQHVLLIAAFVGVKKRAGLELWPVFIERPAEFPTLFQRILSLCLDTSLPINLKLFTLGFISIAFQSLEQELVRKDCAPLVSIAIWHNLHTEAYREKELRTHTTRQKAWRSAQKRFDNADGSTQVKLRFDRAWLYSMVLDFLRRITAAQPLSSLEASYCESFLEFLIGLLSQLPTRRYTIVLLKDLNVLPILKLSSSSGIDGSATLHDLSKLYQHFASLSVSDLRSQNAAHTADEEHYQEVATLQRTALRHYEAKLKVLALSNCAALANPADLESHLSVLSDTELEEFCNFLDLRTAYPPKSGILTGRALFMKTLVCTYCRDVDSRQTVRQMPVLPTDKTLYDPALLRNESYDGSQALALPKLNLQYLSYDDFMWRSFKLYQAEAFYEIRQDIESIVRRMRPKPSSDSSSIHFEGFSKMGLPIDKPAVTEVGPPKVGSLVPSFVRAEVIIDISRLNNRVVDEWESLRSRDTVFLLSILSSGHKPAATTNGSTGTASSPANPAHIRTAEVVQILDDKGRSLRDTQNGSASVRGGRKLRLLLDLDPAAYRNDQESLSRGGTNVWTSINVIVRRQGRENNFKPVLETIQQLVGSDARLPSWLQDVYLGYGDPKSASYPYTSDRISKMDFLDTFLDWEHLQQSFPKHQIAVSDSSETLLPPYVLQLPSALPQSSITSSKKRTRDEMEGSEPTAQVIQASSYRPPNTGPYTVDTPKINTIRFTPTQISAIVAGTQPGLSLVVGPPGTGKTDVATQIINLLYHNFPTERILLIAHSNQALNQLFQKIVALDIDARHLLRLGHGEGELDTEASYSKFGRVESFLDNRQSFLNEVSRLAKSMGVEGAHGSTCETAGYFNQVFVQPAWVRFWSIASSNSVTTMAIQDAFPFKEFFSTAPVPELLPMSACVEELCEIAKGCKHHLDKLFDELESIRPFEILRNSRDQADHLLVKEARIIAMTSTHAAIRRADIAKSGFHYDTLIMEEAAQITEIESFIPCALQNPDLKSGEIPLKRIVLVGDHLQNSPVVQNLALRQYANLEQSLFLRLVRLGVPTVSLDQQGRCRPSIAELFNWRYEGLTNLPYLTTLPEFQRANAGFRHEFQFIDVPDYQGQGEREPTPHFIQNLGEAEYAVALYQYMRLLGYPARSISILAAYAGQKALIRDVLDHRCKGNRLFGLPRTVTTVDKYQGEQNDYVILSLVRTKSVGYLRDVRRLTVALSRARLGLYVLGRKALFEQCFDMKVAMERLNVKDGSEAMLALVTNEMFPTSRLVEDECASVPMEGVEHLGQYVYEMTQAKIKSMGGQLNVIEGDGDFGRHRPDDDLEEEDPLHESV